MAQGRKTGPIGRALRLVAGAYLAIITVPVYLEAGWGYNLRSLGLFAGLTLFYTLMHLVVSRLVPNLNCWAGAVLAGAPVVMVWFFGQGGGPLFGQGEGGTAALTYIGLSLLIDVARADAGCETMAIPSLILRERTHLPCLLLSPIDMLERNR